MVLPPPQWGNPHGLGCPGGQCKYDFVVLLLLLGTDPCGKNEERVGLQWKKIPYMFQSASDEGYSPAFLTHAKDSAEPAGLRNSCS